MVTGPLKLAPANREDIVLSNTTFGVAMATSMDLLPLTLGSTFSLRSCKTISVPAEDEAEAELEAEVAEPLLEGLAVLVLP